MKRSAAFLLVIAWLLLSSSLVGCGLGSKPAPLPSADFTHIYLTLVARLTQTAQPSSGALTLHPTLPPTHSHLTVSPTPQTPTHPPITSSPTLSEPNSTPTPTPICDRAAPGLPRIDVTIDDDTEMRPGEKFTKIWRLANAGECTWSKDYAAVWFSGEKFGETVVVPLNAIVAPGQSVEISVDMTAPLVPGTYQGNWKLRNAANVLFGIGPSGDAPFWVRIIVVEEATATPTPTLAPSFTPTATSPPTHTPTPSPTITPPSSPTATATEAVQASGQANLLPGNSFDLDTGQANTDGDDLAYQLDGNNNHLLVPQAGAQFGIYVNRQPPGPESCRQATMSASPLPVESLPIGAYLCYRTAQGRPGWAQLVAFDAGTQVVTLDFLTWAAK